MGNYVKSAACKRCDSDLAELLQIVDQAHSERCQLHGVRTSVLASSMLMASAKVENYLSELIGDWTDCVNASALPTCELPPAVRARFFNQSDLLGAYTSFAMTRDEHALVRKVIEFMGRDHKNFFAGTEPRPRLYSNWILAGCKYPSPDNLKSLFRRLGISDVFAELQSCARKDVEMSIRSFNDLRSALAHQGDVPGMTRGDVDAKLIEVQEFVGLLDQISFTSFGEISGHSLWRA